MENFLLIVTISAFITAIIVLIMLVYNKIVNNLSQNKSSLITSEHIVSPRPAISPEPVVTSEPVITPVPLVSPKPIISPEPMIPSKPISPTEQKRKIIPNHYKECVLNYHYAEVFIAGVQYLEDNSIINEELLGKEIIYNHEVDNKYDNKAIMLTVDGKKLGYLPRDSKLQDMTYDWLKKELPIYSFVDSIEFDELKITAYIAYYDTLSLKAKKHFDKQKNIKLTGNSNEEMQGNIALSSVGDECEFTYDYDKEKFLVLCGFEIGYLGKNDSELFESAISNEEYYATITEIGENDSGKMFIKISFNYNE